MMDSYTSQSTYQALKRLRSDMEKPSTILQSPSVKLVRRDGTSTILLPDDGTCVKQLYEYCDSLKNTGPESSE